MRTIRTFREFHVTERRIDSMYKLPDQYFILNKQSEAVALGASANEAIKTAYENLGQCAEGLIVAKAVGVINIDARIAAMPKPERVKGNAPVMNLTQTSRGLKFHIFKPDDRTSICSTAWYPRNDQSVTVKPSDEVHSSDFCAYCTKLTNDRSEIQLYDKVV
jgi:hypothetical protein